MPEGLSVTTTCADTPCPETFIERRLMPFLSVSTFKPVGFPSTVMPPTPLGPPPDWKGEIWMVATPSCRAIKLVVELTYPCSPCFSVSSSLSSTNSFPFKATDAFKRAMESIIICSCLALERAASTESFHCRNSLLPLTWALTAVASVTRRRSKAILKNFATILSTFNWFTAAKVQENVLCLLPWKTTYVYLKKSCWKAPHSPDFLRQMRLDLSGKCPVAYWRTFAMSF